MKTRTLLLTLALLWASPAWAQVAKNDSGTRVVDGTGVTSLDLTTFTVSAGSDRCLIAILETNNFSVSSVSMSWDNGGTPQPMTQAVAIENGGSGQRVEIWRLVAPTTGNLTLHAQWTTASDARLGAVAFSGADQSTCIDAANNATATGSSTTPAVTVTSAAGRATVGAMSLVSGLTATTNGQTELWASATPATGASYQTGASSAAHAWSLDGGTAWAAAGVDIKAAAAGGGGGTGTSRSLTGAGF